MICAEIAENQLRTTSGLANPNLITCIFFLHWQTKILLLQRATTCND